MPPAMRVFGTVFASTTLIHGVHFIAAKYSAAAFVSSSVMPLAMAIMTFVLFFLVSALLRAPDLKSAIVCMKYRHRQARDPRVFGTALAVRVMAEAAGPHIRPAAVGDDLGHRRMIAGIPVGGTERVANLRDRKRAAAAGKTVQCFIGSGARGGRPGPATAWRRGCGRRSRGGRSREAIRPGWRRIGRQRQALRLSRSRPAPGSHSRKVFARCPPA